MTRKRRPNISERQAWRNSRTHANTLKGNATLDITHDELDRVLTRMFMMNVISGDEYQRLKVEAHIIVQ